VLLVRAFFAENVFDINEVADFVAATPDEICSAARKRKADAQAVLTALRSVNVTCVRQFLRTAFVLDGEEPALSRYSRLDYFQLRYYLPGFEIRRTFICFIADSIAGGSLRQQTAIESAKGLFSSLERFTACNHGTNASNSNVCAACVNQLSKAAKESMEDISSAARVADSVAARAHRKRFLLLKSASASVAAILRSAVDTATGYSEKFISLGTAESIAYTR